jgi:indolepyruvate ferredoxin oxidoreductase
MANWMDRDTAGLIQMGGEGVDWVSHAMFTRVPHVFQNLGDGTYYHSGYLAIRQAVATGASITYKILYNDAVAMTGGQPVDGVIERGRHCPPGGQRGREAGGGGVGRHRQATTASAAAFRPPPTFHDRAELDAVQRRLREVPGVTVLIYEQTCAAEKRRRRKKGQLAEPEAPVHPRSGLRRLRRLHRAEQLRGGAAARSRTVGAVRPQAPHRPDRLQQGHHLRARVSAPASCG